jgi:hypothetical protein
MLSQRTGCATIASVHVLLVAGTEPDARALADAWAAAAPRCAVEPLAVDLPGPRPAPGPVSSAAPAGPAAVFVPTTALGLSRVPEPPVHPAVVLLRERAARADVVVVHVDVLDAGSLHEGLVAEAARAASPHALPVVVLAGRDTTTRRERAAAGVSGVHEVGEDAVAAVPRVARTWTPAWA